MSARNCSQSWNRRCGKEPGERRLIRYENVEEETFELPVPAAETDPRAREILRAPVYRRMRAIIRISCECCNAYRPHFDVRVFTGRYHTRHVDYLGDGTAKALAIFSSLMASQFLTS